MATVGTRSGEVALCTQDDLYVRDRVRWVVLLSDGTTCYQDDDRPGADPPSAWARLRTYIIAHRLRIDRMWLQFRSHRLEPIASFDGMRGLYCVQRVMACTDDPETYHSYVLGPWENGQASLTVWKSPELMMVGQEERSVDPADPALILF